MPNRTPETALPTLNRVLNLNKKQLLVLLLGARKLVQAKVAKAGANPDFLKNPKFREKTYDDISSVYSVLKKGLGLWIETLVWSTVMGSVFRADLEFDDDPTEERVTRFSRRYVVDMLRLIAPINAESLIATQTDRMRQQDIAFLRQTVMDVLRRGSVTGATFREQQRELARLMLDASEGGMPGWQFVDKAGRTWQNGNYFNMLMRTVGNRVARETYLERLTEQGYDLVTIEGGGDPCPVCTKWRGVICSITGATKGFPTLKDAQDDGVFHPNCLCEPRYYDATELDAAVKAPISPDDPGPKPNSASGGKKPSKGRTARFSPLRRGSMAGDDVPEAAKKVIAKENRLIKSRIADLEKWIAKGRPQ
jgi:hypothetical protein